MRFSCFAYFSPLCEYSKVFCWMRKFEIKGDWYWTWICDTKEKFISKHPSQQNRRKWIHLWSQNVSEGDNAKINELTRFVEQRSENHCFFFAFLFCRFCPIKHSITFYICISFDFFFVQFSEPIMKYLLFFVPSQNLISSNEIMQDWYQNTNGMPINKNATFCLVVILLLLLSTK